MSLGDLYYRDGVGVLRCCACLAEQTAGHRIDCRLGQAIDRVGRIRNELALVLALLEGRDNG